MMVEVRNLKTHYSRPPSILLCISVRKLRHSPHQLELKVLSWSLHLAQVYYIPRSRPTSVNLTDLYDEIVYKNKFCSFNPVFLRSTISFLPSRMPTFLLNGFRWHRQNIRVHVAAYDLEDATPEWVLAPATSISLLDSFYKLYDFLPSTNRPAHAYDHLQTPPLLGTEDEPLQEPLTMPKIKKTRSIMSPLSRSMSRKSRRPADPAPAVNGDGNGHNDRKGSNTEGSDARSSTTSGSMHGQSTGPEKKSDFNDWSVVKLMEQYDLSSTSSLSQPYAYVADYMVEVSLGVALTEEMAKYDAKMKMDDRSMNSALTQNPGTPDAPRNVDRRHSISTSDMRKEDRELGWLEKLRDGLQAGEDIGWHVVVCGDQERVPPSMESERERLGLDDDAQLRTPRSAGFRGLFRKQTSRND